MTMDKQEEAVWHCLETIIQVLCCDVSIPQSQKIDMVNALGKVAEAFIWEDIREN